MLKCMKASHALPLLAAAFFATALSTSAATFNDPSGDFTGGNNDLDIASVLVNNDGTTLTFTINLAGNPQNNNWYNYYVGISRNLFGGVGGNFNAAGGYGKNIQMSSGGMDYVLASYPAFAGYDLKTWNGSSWNQASGVASENTTSVTIPVALSSLGLSPGDTFKFDVWASTSGGDTVLDALSDGASRSWNSDPFDTGGNGLSYTVAIPEPATLSLFGIAALVIVRRRNRLSVD
jgi:hypothetical protein